MLHITSHQENENQNCKMLSLKSQVITSIGKDMKKLEPSYTSDGKVRWYSHARKQPGHFA
jgi:hypothetical protein